MSTTKTVRDAILKANARFNIFTSIRDNFSAKEGLPLSGLYTAIKDNIATKDEASTCSSTSLKHYKSPFESTVSTLLQENGAAIVGKTNMDEFGMGSATVNSCFGPTLNPAFAEEERVPGGSSGGSAAAVAADLVDFSIGTDTGGSVRLPAAYTGISAFKPSYGRISRWGVIAYSQSLDTVGILSKDVETIERVYQVLDKYDPQDPTSLTHDQREHILASKIPKNRPLKIGIVKEFKLNEISADIMQGWIVFLKALHAQGHHLVQLSMPIMKSALSAYYTLAPAEASSNLARYDGIRYGHRSELSDDPTLGHFNYSRNEGFGTEVKRRIMVGTYNLSSEAYKNHFIKAQAVRQNVKDEFNMIFKANNILSDAEGNPDGVDFIVCPTAITDAPTLKEVQQQEAENPLETYVNDVLTVPMSLAGLPTLTVPWFSEDSNTPSSIQIVGQYGHDSEVLDFGKHILQV